MSLSPGKLVTSHCWSSTLSRFDSRSLGWGLTKLCNVFLGDGNDMHWRTTIWKSYLCKSPILYCCLVPRECILRKNALLNAHLVFWSIIKCEPSKHFILVLGKKLQTTLDFCWILSYCIAKKSFKECIFRLRRNIKQLSLLKIH